METKTGKLFFQHVPLQTKKFNIIDNFILELESWFSFFYLVRGFWKQQSIKIDSVYLCWNIEQHSDLIFDVIADDPNDSTMLVH